MLRKERDSDRDDTSVNNLKLQHEITHEHMSEKWSARVTKEKKLQNTRVLLPCKSFKNNLLQQEKTPRICFMLITMAYVQVLFDAQFHH